MIGPADVANLCRAQVGCWDGNVAVIKLAPSAAQVQALRQQQQQQQQPGANNGAAPPAAGGLGSGPGWELLACFPAERTTLRAAKWIPPAACAGALDLVHRHVFLSAGHAGAVNIWDDRCGGALGRERRGGVGWASNGLWVAFSSTRRGMRGGMRWHGDGRQVWHPDEAVR